MKLWMQRLTLATAGLAIIWSLSAILIQAQTPAAPARGATTPAAPARGAGQVAPTAPAGTQKAGTYFKNVTTSTLKELTVDDFIASMGVISAALGYDCADCHPGAGTDARDFAIDTIPQKKTARKMIEMVASINQNNFSGIQQVTCWTCHRQQERPATSIALDHLYESPNVEDPDIAFAGVGKQTADQILDKYIQAAGGAQRLATLTSFVATGASDGYGGFGGEGEFSLYAKSPNQRTTIIFFKDHPERGESIWTVNGTRGWVKTPRGFLSQYELTGVELAGAKLEAQLAFPGQIKSVLTNWRVGLDRAIGDKDYNIVQGNGARGPYRDELATLYFDKTTGLLRRLIRYGPSPVGRIPVQIDYTDYRDVNGIKFPYEIKFSWLDGKYTANIKDIKVNVAIDAAKFAEPKGN